MVVPTRVTVALAARIREEEDREGVVQEVLQVARIEHAFLTAKECVGFFNESLSREKMELARKQGAYPALVFTAVQVSPPSVYICTKVSVNMLIKMNSS